MSVAVRRRVPVRTSLRTFAVPPGDVTAAEWTGLTGRTDPGDSPPDSLVVRTAGGTPVSVTVPHVYAQARGLKVNDLSAAAANSAIINQIWSEGKFALLPPATVSAPIYVSADLVWRTGVGLIGPGRVKCNLFYTGAGDGMRGLLSDNPSGLYRCYLEGITLTFAGSGSTANGMRTDCWRYSEMRDVRLTNFPASGLTLVGVAGGSQGTWSSRWYNCEFSTNGKHGLEATGGNHNAHKFYGVQASLNGLDGVYAETPQHWTWGFQPEGNGRHGVHLLGGYDEDLSGIYIEHQDPEYFAASLRPPGWTKQSPRYMIKVGASPTTGQRTYVVRISHALLSGAHNGTTVITDAAVFIADTDRAIVTHNTMLNVKDDRFIQIDPATVDSREVHSNHFKRQRPTAANQLTAIPAAYGTLPIAGAGGGPVGRDEGFRNLLTNGGFDTYTTTPGAPDGWSSNGIVTVTRENGLDGGYRAVITNGGASAFGNIRQDITGNEVKRLAQRGKGVIVFNAITPTTNTVQACQVRVQCLDVGSTVLGGGINTGATSLPASNSEVTYWLPFHVPAGTVTIRVIFYASAVSTSNTDVLKVDQVAVYGGEVPKAYAPAPLSRPPLLSSYTVTNLTTDRSFDADTVTLAELADIVGTLITDLKGS